MRPAKTRGRTGLQHRAIGLLVLAGGSLGLAIATPAQVVPDRSLGSSASRVQRDVVIDGRRSDLIRGGRHQGGNVFHSFSTFSIPANQRVYFNAPPGVARILARVTGPRPSQIHGTLGALGLADVFLLNPNGIVFGPDARLDLRGSFIASTATAIEFGDRGQFRADPTPVSPLLTIQPTALHLPTAPQPIVQRSFARDASNRVVGLQVDPGRSLLLVGGDVILAGGIITGAGSTIELAAAQGRVELLPQGAEWRLRPPRDRGQGEVLLRDIAGILVSGANAGRVALYGASLRIEGGSGIVAGINDASSRPSSRAGDITLDATGPLRIQDSLVANLVDPGARGTGGDIRLRADTIWMGDRAQLQANNFSWGDAGDIILTTGSLVLDRAGLFTVSNQGDTGDMVLRADRDVTLSDSTLFAAITGRGNAGEIRIHAGGEVTLDRRSLVISSVEPGAVGRSGDLSITGRALTLIAGSQLRSDLLGVGVAGDIRLTIDGPIEMDGVSGPGSGDSTSRSQASAITSNLFFGGRGRAGNIDIQADTLSLTNGAFIFSSTAGQGDAGTIRLEIDRRLTIASPEPGALSSGIAATVNETGVGNGGDVVVQADELVLRQAVLTAASGGDGDAGNLDITARTVLLDDAVVATTGRSRNGGNLTFRDLEVLLLDNGAVITAATALSGAQGNGGNITLEADVIVADPLEDNDIAANAEGGRGGNITLTTEGLLGIAPRSTRSPLTSDINASSRLSVDGRVTINQSGVEPSPTPVDLPTVFSAPPLAQGCRTQGDRHRFVVTGRGSLPVNPTAPLVADWLWQDLGYAQGGAPGAPAAPAEESQDGPQVSEWSEAQGWRVAPDGRITLLAAC